MSDKPRYVLVAGTYYLLEVIATDPQKRAELLTLAKCRRATGQYRNLVRLLAEHDASTGATALVARRLQDAPERTNKQIVAALRRRQRW